MTKHTVVIGDASRMSELKNESINLSVTSPPYWNLKDYGTSNQIGQSDGSYKEYLNRLFMVFRECVRVLKPDGKLVINIMPIFLSGKLSPKLTSLFLPTFLALTLRHSTTLKDWPMKSGGLPQR